MSNKAIIEFSFRRMASVDNTFRDLQNSSYPTHPHSIIANYVTEMFRLDLNGAEIWPNS